MATSNGVNSEIGAHCRSHIILIKGYLAHLHSPPLRLQGRTPPSLSQLFGTFLFSLGPAALSCAKVFCKAQSPARGPLKPTVLKKIVVRHKWRPFVRVNRCTTCTHSHTHCTYNVFTFDKVVL